MAIQNRRGQYSDFDPTKMVEGEWAVVQSGDPNSSRGRAVYMAFQNGETERMATYEDMEENINSITEDIQETLTENVEQTLTDATTTVTNAVSSMQTTVNETLTEATGRAQADVTEAVSQARSDVASTIQNANDTVSGLQASVTALEAEVNSGLQDMDARMDTIETDYEGMKTNNSTQLYNMEQSVSTAINNIQGAAATATEAAQYATSQADAVREIIESGSTVVTFNGRIGAVVPESGDYDSTQVAHGSGSVSDALSGKQDRLIAGNGIDLDNNVISVDSEFQLEDPSNVYYDKVLTVTSEANKVIVTANGTEYVNPTAGTTFDLRFPILYCTTEQSTVTGTGKDMGVYMIYSGATNPVESGTTNTPIYLKGTVSGNTFKVDSSEVYTQTIEQTSYMENGATYLNIGIANASDGSAFLFSPKTDLQIYDSVSGVTPLEKLAEEHDILQRVNLINSKNVLPDNTDFNSLFAVGKAGVYQVTTAQNAQTMSNIPEKFSGKLIVGSITGNVSGYAFQIYITNTRAHVWYRTKGAESATPSDWIRLDNNAIGSDAPITNANDSILQGQVYYAGGNVTNAPSTGYYSVWNEVHDYASYITQFAAQINVTAPPAFYVRGIGRTGTAGNYTYNWSNWGEIPTAPISKTLTAQNGVSISQVSFFRYGRMASLAFICNITGTITSGSDFTIATVPNDMVPLVNTMLSGTIRSNRSTWIGFDARIRTNGTITMGVQADMSGCLLRINSTYITAN